MGVVVKAGVVDVFKAGVAVVFKDWVVVAHGILIVKSNAESVLMHVTIASELRSMQTTGTSVFQYTFNESVEYLTEYGTVPVHSAVSPLGMTRMDTNKNVKHTHDTITSAPTAIMFFLPAM